MKILTTLLLSLICVNLFAGSFYIINTNGITKLENIINDTVTNESITIGRTYGVDTNNYSIITHSNSSITLKFSNNTTVRMNESTTVIINNFDQNIINTNNFPERLKYDDASLTLSLLQGQVEIVNNSTTSNLTYIATPQVTISPINSKSIIKGDSGSTMVVGFEGITKMIDNLNRKKTVNVESGDVVMVTPQPILGTGKGMDVNKKQNMFTNSKLDDAELINYKESFTNLVNDHTNVMFILFGDKIYGVKD